MFKVWEMDNGANQRRNECMTLRRKRDIRTAIKCCVRAGITQIDTMEFLF